MKCIFLYSSEDKKIKRNYCYIIKELSVIFSIDSYECKSILELKENIISRALNYEVLLFSGGDGTFSNVVNILYKNNIKINLAYIPTGTACDIAHNLKLSKNIKKAVKTILKENLTKHDLGSINDRYFMYISGVGTFTKVSYKANKHLKKILGVNAYTINGLSEVLRPIVMKADILIDDKELSVYSPLILIMNSKSIGGVKINSEGHRDDGTLDLIIVKKAISNVLSISRLVINHIKKNKPHKSYYDIYRGKSIEIKLDKEYKWNIDGEEGMTGNANIKVLEKAISIYTN